MDELFRQYEAGTIPYMPANWQSHYGATFMGVIHGVCFFDIKGLEIDDEKIPDGIRYAALKDIQFDRKMNEVTLRIKKRKRS